MILVVCDRCRAQIEDSDARGIISTDFRMSSIDHNPARNHYHLCQSCLDDLADFIKKVKRCRK